MGSDKLTYFDTHKVAILLRGFHYKENYATRSTFSSAAKLRYTVDFERVFLETFRKAIVNKLSDYDVFISTYPSKKQELLVKELDPADTMFIGHDSRFQYKKKTQLTGMLSGLEILKSYADKNNINYDFVICLRLDLDLSENMLEVLSLDYDKFNFITEGHRGFCGRRASDRWHMFSYDLIDQVYDSIKRMKDSHKGSHHLHDLPQKLHAHDKNRITEPRDQIYDLVKMDREYYTANRNRSFERRFFKWVKSKFGSWKNFKKSGGDSTGFK
jgi:hypothetical protein